MSCFIVVGFVLVCLWLLYLTIFYLNRLTTRRYVRGLLRKLVGEMQQLTTELGREPTEQEIKDRLNPKK